MNAQRLIIVLLTGFVSINLASESRADFILWNDEQLTVSTSHSNGTLYDNSTVRVVSDGYVSTLCTFNNSNVQVMSNGYVNTLYAHDSCSIDIPGNVYHLCAQDSCSIDITGSIYQFAAYNSCIINVSGGWLRCSQYIYHSSIMNISGGALGGGLCACDSSIINISGGSISSLSAGGGSYINISAGDVDYLSAHGSSNVTFVAREFRLGPGLWLGHLADGRDKVHGTGILSGEWYNGERWTTCITRNDSGGTILAIPEPVTLSLLALGGLVILHRRRRDA